ncbi:Sodium-coupled monocarboxylate transporter 1 [Holothuria leucospilota]|uniref:Sodium-coupled monocarboxylate transporter 1 n=1 Tax=Holothuria leucospilota TaxID=206669 RepID=A0A9Q1BCJ2_HOLLE|nr:Sodium-coupled monocarboxylate transporter 1 [Holothuria leucospilota]
MAVPGEVATFTVWDYLVIAAVLLVSTCIGIYYALAGGRQRTAREFLLADRSMNPMPVAMSLVASFISAITVLGTPAEVYRHGTMYWIICFAFILTGFITSRSFMTIFYEYEITSTNEYLERRFNKYVRYLGTALFFLQMILYLGFVIYAPALSLNAVTGLTLWGSVITIGIVCTFYTTIGGLKAVLWTDVFQVCIMMSGLLAVIIEGSIKLGGLREAWNIAESRGRIDLWDFRFDPTIRHTFWALAFGQAFLWTSSYGVNQSQVQRYLSCGKKSTAQFALGLAIVGLVIVVSIACLAGVVMFAYYADCDPYTMGYITAIDQLMPYFVMDLFGDRPGLPGLFTSCVFSAALSTVSSGLNSLAAISGEDIIKSIWPNISETRYTIATKLLACTFGAIAILTTVLASQFEAILQASLSIFGLVGGPLLALFSLGVFFPCVNSYGAGFGTLLGFATSLWLGAGANIYPPDSNPPSLSTAMCYVNATDVPGLLTTPISTSQDDYPPIAAFYSLSYCWYSGFSWAVCIVLGLLISFATGHNNPSKADVTLHRSIVDSFLCCFPETCTNVCRCGVPPSEEKIPTTPLENTYYAEERKTPSDLEYINIKSENTKF